LACTYFPLYVEQAVQNVLSKTIAGLCKAIDIQQKDAYQRILSLSMLSSSLHLRYHEPNTIEDIRESRNHALTALQLGRCNKIMAYELYLLRELCEAHHLLWRVTHTPEDIQAAIDYGKQGLSLPNDPDEPRSFILDSLSNAYYARFEIERCNADLNEAIKRLELAIKSIPISNTQNLSSVDRFGFRLNNALPLNDEKGINTQAI